MKKGCIYSFIDDKNVPYYVGQTVDFKRRSQIHKSHIMTGNMAPKYCKARKLMIKGFDFKMVIIKENINKNLLDKEEIKEISRLKNNGVKLYNLTKGGKPNKEDLIKINQRKNGKSWGCHSTEAKKKMSEIAKGRIFTKEHKEKLSIARRKRITTENTKKKMSESMKGKTNIKKYIVVGPNGDKFITENGLTQFCKEHSLNRPNLLNEFSGKRKSNSKWKIERRLK